MSFDPTDQRAKSAFTRLVSSNRQPMHNCDDYCFRLCLREAIALTVVDLIDMECDPRTVHETANWYRFEMGIPMVADPIPNL